VNGAEQTIYFSEGSDNTTWFADVTGATSPADSYTVGGMMRNNAVFLPYEGEVDDVYIYSDVLTGAEIRALYGHGPPDCFDEDDGCTYNTFDSSAFTVKSWGEIFAGTALATYTQTRDSNNVNAVTYDNEFTIATTDWSTASYNLTMCPDNSTLAGVNFNFTTSYGNITAILEDDEQQTITCGEMGLFYDTVNDDYNGSVFTTYDVSITNGTSVSYTVTESTQDFFSWWQYENVTLGTANITFSVSSAFTNQSTAIDIPLNGSAVAYVNVTLGRYLVLENISYSDPEFETAP